MIDEFLNLFGITQIHRQNIVEFSVDDGARGHLKTSFGPIIGNFGEVAVAKNILTNQAAAVLEPIRIERGNRLNIGKIHVFDEFDGLTGDVAHVVHRHFVDHRTGSARSVHVNRASDAADQIVRMRVLAAQNRVNLDDFTLEIQGF